MKPGDVIEDWSAVDENGTTVRLSEMLENGPVVLFFYPAAKTAL